MNVRLNARLSLVLPLALLAVMILAPLQVSVAQDGGTDPVEQDWANVEGVGEIAKTADNFNVSAVPSQEEAKAVVTSPPAISALEQAAANFDEDGMLRAMGVQIFSNRPIKYDESQRSFIAKRIPPRQTPSGEVLLQLDDPSSGAVLTVFTDYTLVEADAKGEVIFQGYIAGESVESLMIVGQDTEGTQYALSRGDAIALATDGNVFLGSGDHFYLYNYDKEGNFVGLTDGDGNEYAVETTDDGGYTITDGAGDIGDFNPDGSYDIKDPAGDVLDQGALFGPNDGD